MGNLLPEARFSHLKGLFEEGEKALAEAIALAESLYPCLYKNQCWPIPFGTGNTTIYIHRWTIY
jgi:hypothetical protein